MTNSNNKPSSKKRAIQMFALFFILILLPFGTWFFSKMGLNYFVEMVGEFHQYETIPDFAIANHTGKVLTKKDLKGKVVVTGFFGNNEVERNLVGDRMSKLYDLFKEDENIVFLLKSLEEAPISKEALHAFAQHNQFTDIDNCYVLGNDQSGSNTLLGTAKWPSDYGQIDKSEAYNLVPFDNQLSKYPYLIIADTGQVIRNYYNYEDSKNMARMVEHIAILMPSRAKKKPVLQRESEK